MSGTGISVVALRRCGVHERELFGRRNVAHRSVESVEATRVEVLLGQTSAWLPRSLITGSVSPGQWLRFTRGGTQVRVEVDLHATLRAEARLAELFTALS